MKQLARSTSVVAMISCLLALMAAPTFAQSKGGEAATEEIKLMDPVTTEHSITIAGTAYDYEATVGYFVQRDEKQNPVGYFFYTAYKLKNGGIERPLTFVFNGGPGSSSIYLHMLTIGPKIAALDDEGNTPGPPPTFKDNSHTWLPFTDLVFIDPIGTGFSFPHPGSDTKHYWGAMEDARSVANFIRMYITDSARWLSPIVIAGESYGGIRGPLLAMELHNSRQIKLNVNGLIFISPAFEMNSLAISKHNPQNIYQYMPTMAATSWHHGKVDRTQFESFDAFYAEVVQWSRNDYLLALEKGDAIDEQTYNETAEAMVKYLGVDRQWVDRENLRILSHEFRQELMANEGMDLDRLDARWETGAYELTTTLSPVLNHYIRVDLGYNTDRAYTVSGYVRPWPFDSRFGSGFTVIPVLSQIMKDNRSLKVLSTAGYYDYACPVFSIDYALDQLQLKPELRENITRTYYHAGHMVYTPKDELENFTNDVREFYKALTR